MPQSAPRSPATWVARLCRAAALVCCPLAPAGCASLHKSPVAENVVVSRQLTHQGMSAMQQDRWEVAESLLARAVADCPADHRARALYSETLWRRGARGEAIAQMRQAAEMSGGDPQQRVRLGEMLLQQRDAAGAAEQATAALRVSPQMVSAWVLKGEVHRQTGQWNHALECFHRALSYDPHIPAAQLAAADVYRRLNRPDRAVAALDALARQYPPGQTPQDVLIALGTVQKDLGRSVESVETLTAALAAGPPSGELLYQLSDARFKAGDPANARISLAQALKLAPNHAAGRRLEEEIAARQRMAALNEASLYQRAAE